MKILPGLLDRGFMKVKSSSLKPYHKCLIIQLLRTFIIILLVGAILNAAFPGCFMSTIISPMSLTSNLFLVTTAPLTHNRNLLVNQSDVALIVYVKFSE